MNGLWSKLEVALVVCLILIVWGLSSLPIVFFHLPVQEVHAQTGANTTKVSTANTTCSQSSKSLSADSLCYGHLDNILENICPQDTGETISIINDEEEIIQQLQQGLNFLSASETCAEKVIPFMCQFMFGLCTDSGYLLQPTSSQCTTLQREVCQAEWKAALAFGFQLPDCDSLPSSPPLCPLSSEDNITSTEESESLPSSEDSATVKILECTQGFYQENGSSACIPSCHAWTQHEPTNSIAIDVIVFTAAFVGFFAAVAVLVISVVRRKRMLAFPAILVVYMVIDCLAVDMEAASLLQDNQKLEEVSNLSPISVMTTYIIAFFMLVNYMDRPGLSCSYESLIKSSQKVTPFCVISGMLFSYTLFQLGFWWLLHTALFFWKVVFPFHSRSYEVSGRMKRVHIAGVTVGLILPLSTIVTSMVKFAVNVQKRTSNETSSMELFLSGGLGYTNARFPPILCAGSDRYAVFYSTVLPLDLAQAIGSTMLLIVFLQVHRQHSKLKVKDSKHIFTFGTAEKKLLIVLSYYIVLSSVALTSFTLATRNVENLISGFQEYFFCEQGGFDPEGRCTRDYRKYSYPSLSTISYALLGLFPVVNLFYAINLKELKAALPKWLPKSKRSHSLPRYP